MGNVLAAMVYASLVPLAFWFGGFDFNHRGMVALLCFTSTVLVFVWVYSRLVE